MDSVFGLRQRSVCTQADPGQALGLVVGWLVAAGCVAYADHVSTEILRDANGRIPYQDVALRIFPVRGVRRARACLPVVRGLRALSGIFTTPQPTQKERPDRPFCTKNRQFDLSCPSFPAFPWTERRIFRGEFLRACRLPNCLLHFLISASSGFAQFPSFSYFSRAKTSDFLPFCLYFDHPSTFTHDIFKALYRIQNFVLVQTIKCMR